MRTLGLAYGIAFLALAGGCHLLFPFDVAQAPDASVDAAVDRALTTERGSYDQLLPDGAVPDLAGNDQVTNDLPANDLPAVDLPANDLPANDLQVPDAPLPDAPLPDAPLPDAPLPDSPVPDSPVPDSPVPDSPVPDSPVPDAGKINLALSATASSSGGGTNFFTPDKMNDGYREAQCVSHHFHWVSPTPPTPPPWIQLEWSKAVTIGQVWFDTSAQPSGSCAVGINRTLTGGKLEYWHVGLGVWTLIKVTTGKTTDWSLTFAPVSTTKLRLYKAVAINSIYNATIYEWEVYAN